MKRTQKLSKQTLHKANHHGFSANLNSMFITTHCSFFQLVTNFGKCSFPKQHYCMCERTYSILTAASNPPPQVRNVPSAILVLWWTLQVRMDAHRIVFVLICSCLFEFVKLSNFVMIAKRTFYVNVIRNGD